MAVDTHSEQDRGSINSMNPGWRLTQANFEEIKEEIKEEEDIESVDDY